MGFFYANDKFTCSFARFFSALNTCGCFNTLTSNYYVIWPFVNHGYLFLLKGPSFEGRKKTWHTTDQINVLGEVT